MPVGVGNQGSFPYGAGPASVALSGVGATSTIVVVVNTSDGDISSITDNASTPYSWSAIGYERPSSTNIWQEMWVGTGGSGGAFTITVNVTAGAIQGYAIELSGCNQSFPYQSGASGTSNTSGGTITSASLIPSGAGCLMLTGQTSGGGVVSGPSSPWVDTTSVNYVCYAYQANLTSGTTYSNSWTTNSSNGNTTFSAIFQPPPPPPAYFSGIQGLALLGADIQGEGENPTSSGTSASAGFAGASASAYAPTPQVTVFPTTAGASAAAYTPGISVTAFSTTAGASANAYGPSWEGSTPPVTGYEAWFDASKIEGLADDTAVSSWPDLSGNGYTMSQATSGDQPTYYESTAGKLVNGLPAVWFNGSSDYLSTTSAISTAASNVTMFLVCGNTSVPSGDFGLCAFLNGHNGTSGNNGYGIAVATGSAYGSKVGWLDPGIAWETSSQAEDTSGSVHVYSLSIGTSSASMTFDQGSELSTGYGTITAPSGSAILGWDGGSGDAYVNGPICEAILYPSLLTAAQTASVNSYLYDKWLGVPSTTASAGFASASATAYGPTPEVQPSAGLAGASASAYTPSLAVQSTAGIAGASPTAYAPGLSAITFPTVAGASPTAYAPTPQVITFPSLSGASASAYNASVTTFTSTTASAGLAGASATAYQPALTVDVTATGLAGASANGYAPTITGKPTAGLAGASANAYTPLSQITAFPTTAAASAAAYGPAFLTATAGLAGASANAYTPTISVTSPGGLAGASPTAYAPGISVKPTAGLAGASAAAYPPEASAWLAAASATAYEPLSEVTVFPSTAGASAIAYNPVAGSGQTAQAGLASVTASAYEPTFAPTFTSGIAGASASAYNPTPTVSALPTLAGASATAYGPHFAPTFTAGFTQASVTAYGPALSVTAFPITAGASATAYNPSGQVGVAGASAAAYQPAITVQLPAGLAGASANAYAPLATPGFTASSAGASATAYGPGVNTAWTTSSAGASTTAYPSSAIVVVSPWTASASATAYQPIASGGSLIVSAGLASATATAFDPAAGGSQTAQPDVAAVSATAYDATIILQPPVTAQAGLAAVVAAAFNPTITVIAAMPGLTFQPSGAVIWGPPTTEGGGGDTVRALTAVAGGVGFQVGGAVVGGTGETPEDTGSGEEEEDDRVSFQPSGAVAWR